MDVIKVNRATDRMALACDCGDTFTLPCSGESKHRCSCGVTWYFDEHGITSVTVPTTSKHFSLSVHIAEPEPS